MTDDEALNWYKKTGQYLGRFKTPEDAGAYAEQLHQAQAALPDWEQLINRNQ